VHVDRLAGAADEVRRAGQHLDRRDAGGERASERGILRPERVDRADLRLPGRAIPCNDFSSNEGEME